jgi:beta-mannosidase
MPCQVQELVYERKILPDPHYGDNAAKWTTVFDKDWIYVTRFISPKSTNEVFLCFDGLDTRADILLNGQKVAECNSMFIHFRFPVKKILLPAGRENILAVRFYSPTEFISSIAAKTGKQPYADLKYLRKCYTDFGSYMGARPNFLKMGIFDNVYLDVVPASFLGDVYIRSRLNKDYSNAKIVISPDVNGNNDLKINYILGSPGGRIINQATISVADSFSIDIDKPELWWPFTYGTPSLYNLTLRLMDGSAEIDKQSFNLGIRDIKMYLKDDATGEDRFGFIINGKKIFMNGACWAPLEGFTHVWNVQRANRLLDIMIWGNMNILRVWGEGSLPGKSFYDECDRRGILVWQEFFTGGGMGYPLEYPGFKENIEAEAENLIKLLRNHSSIAMWCGGNEHFLSYPSLIKGTNEPPGRELFLGIFPKLVTQFDPGRYYHPSSPWGGDNWPNGNYPLTGDYHDYSTIRYQSLSSVPLFTSEAAMVSPYSFHDMQRYMPEEDLWPKDFNFKIDKPGKIAWPAGWEKHTTADGWQKTGNIQDYIDIQNAEEACRIFGTAHGVYLKERYERQRRGIPDGQPDGNRRSWGAMIWRLNDTWPIIYMSVVDYYLEPKIPYYFLKRACSPVLVSFEQTSERICTWVVNDSPQVVKDTLTVELWSFDGTMKSRKEYYVDIQPGLSRRVADLIDFYDINKRREFFVARLGKQVETHLLWPEKYLILPDAEIKAIKTDQGITLSSSKFVKEVELYPEGTSGAVFSDNYFNLIPGESRTIKILFTPEGSKTLRIKGVNSSIATLEM